MGLGLLFGGLHEIWHFGRFVLLGLFKVHARGLEFRV